MNQNNPETKTLLLLLMYTPLIAKPTSYPGEDAMRSVVDLKLVNVAWEEDMLLPVLVPQQWGASASYSLALRTNLAHAPKTD